MGKSTENKNVEILRTFTNNVINTNLNKMDV